MAARNADALLRAATGCFRAGRLVEAEGLYRQVLHIRPNDAVALHCLGLIAQSRGELTEAASLLEQSLRSRPLEPTCLNNLGVLYRLLGRLDEACAVLSKAAELRPSLSEAHANLGMSYRQQGELEKAEKSLRLATQWNPRDVKAHDQLGVVLHLMGKLSQAKEVFLKALSICSHSVSTLEHLVDLYRHVGDWHSAIACQRELIGLEPQNAARHDALGCLLLRAGRVDDAIAAFEHALTLAPGSAGIHVNFATAMKESGQLDAAIAAFRHAMTLAPDENRWYSALLMTLHYAPNQDSQSLYQEHLGFQRRFGDPLRKEIRPHDNDRVPDRRLRIGYVSPDFCNHVASRFMLPLLSNHDRRHYEIYCYASVEMPDGITRRFQEQADVWRDIVAMPDEQAADLIRRDNIDILVDLAMHSAGNRLLVFAHKPAPVQVTYLAYCGGTTGLNTVDYRLSNPHLDPPELGDRFCTERVARLPETYWCYGPPEAAEPIRPPPVLTSGHITFGCLNMFYKVNEPMVANWCRLMGAVADSHLVLHAPPGAHRDRMLGVFAEHGVTADRVSFRGRVPVSEYFRLYHELDIALDTYPFTGGTTTCDALWMGVPVVSLAGEHAITRGGLSILSNVGLPQLVASSSQQYVDIAAHLAGDLTQLSTLRQELRPRMVQSALLDARRFVGHLEAAYRQMWREWCAGE